MTERPVVDLGLSMTHDNDQVSVEVDIPRMQVVITMHRLMGTCNHVTFRYEPVLRFTVPAPGLVMAAPKDMDLLRSGLSLMFEKVDIRYRDVEPIRLSA